MPEGFQALSFNGIYMNIFSLVVDDTVTKRIFPPVATPPSKCLVFSIGLVKMFIGNLERTMFSLEVHYITEVAWEATQHSAWSTGLGVQ